MCTCFPTIASGIFQVLVEHRLIYQSFKFHAMGGPCELKLYAESAQAVETAAEAAMAEVQRIETKYSRYRDDSIVSRINKLAGRSGVVVDDETAALLNYANTAFEQSDGLFDITSGVLRKVWDFTSGKLPQPEALAECCQKIGWQRVVWNGSQCSLPEAGMEIDFGGFGKEYAADRAADICREHGIEHGLVELGGDIHVLGPHPDNSPWQIGLRNPRQPDQAIDVVSISRGGLASSGDYERFMLVDGVRYSHLLNPFTGWPVASNLAQVSVLAPLCLVAGTGATVSMLKGESGEAWLQTLTLPYVAVTPQGQISRRF